MNIKTGPPVSGENFFSRQQLVTKSWDMIESGKHILFVAPRRVGKTSLMHFLRDKPKENYTLLFLNTESVNNKNEFFRRVLNKVLKTDFVEKSQKVLTFLERHKPAIKKLGWDGVEFGVNDQNDYWEMLSGILLSPQSDTQKLIIMIDEFPETLANIVNDESENAGRQFLHSNRELRQNMEEHNNVQFIYAGSIGLENIVSRLNAVNTINDLSILKIPPLNENEAKQLIKQLVENINFELSESLIEHILQKIEWFIPFYIQLIIDEIRNIHRDENPDKITEEIVNWAFDGILEQRQHFEHWHTRIRATLESDDYNFVKELLNITSENNKIHSNEILDLAVKYKLEENYNDLFKSLVYDGYINNDDDPNIYRYNSPILRMWWRKNVAN